MRRVARRDERGMVIVLVGIVIMVLMTLTALVVDHSLLRNDRRADQKVADAAATAGAFLLGTDSGQDACEAALGYLEENTPGVTSFDGADCSGFLTSACNPATAAVTTTGTAGAYRIQIVHPVPDGHPLMSRASALGSPSLSVSAADGSQCQRLGVVVELTRGPSFGTVLGADDARTRVHTVAKAGSALEGRRPINLLVLERYACQAVAAEGQGDLRLGAITGHSGELLPGILAIDSSGHNLDGTLGANCGTTASPDKGTLHLQGSNSRVQADGPPGCSTQVTLAEDAAAVPGDGCGYIELLAEGVPGPASPLYCASKTYWPACTSTGMVRPHPVRMLDRRTREPFDHRFDCRSDYSADPWFGEHPIKPCGQDDPGTVDADYVSKLLAFANTATPPGFSVYTGPCSLESAPVVFPEGNWLIDCDTFTVKTRVVFRGGNVIFDGNVNITSGTGDLSIHACGREPGKPETTGIGPNSCSPVHPLVVDGDVSTPEWTGLRDDKGRWTHADDYDERQYSNDAAWVVLRNGGGINKDAQAKFHLYDSAMFFQRNAAYSSTQVMALSGGSGSLIWHAPREGPFDVLAMWSDSELIHDMGGQAGLEMEGVYFAPVARLVFRGNGSQQQVAAQLITERLTVTGSGRLIVVPNIHRSINHYRPPASALIR